MKILMESLYDNLDEAKAFRLNFTNMIFIYPDTCLADYDEVLCERCGHCVQIKDYLMPRSQCKKPYAILDSLNFGVDEQLRSDLIENFDITERDFRPIKNKKGEIVYYQITPEHTMIPIGSVNGWKIIDCRVCDSIRYSCQHKQNDKGEDYYFITQEALDEMHDLNVTFEKHHCFMPMIVISRRLYDYLIKRFPRSQYIPFFLK